ncbi:MAG: hypothetical protein NVS2B4_03090 [Ramlibacter sp.]
MASARTLARLDVATWVLIYGGLFGIVLGLVTGPVDGVAAWSVAGGIVLILVRSRLAETPVAGAQSSDTPAPRQGPR